MTDTYLHRIQLAAIRAGLCVGLFLSISLVGTAQLQLTFPVPRIVFQRNNANQAAVPFRAVVTSTVTQVKVRLVVRQGGITTGWMTFTPANGLVSGHVPGVQGGWYDLEIESFNGSVSLGTNRVQRVGVGEVLLASGQSNAQGFSYDTGAADDRVSCVDYYDEEITEYRFPLKFSQLSNSIGNVGPTNFLYIYGLLGDKLVQRLGVPVLIYGAAMGGTSSIQWRQTAEGLLIPDASQWGGAEDLRPYRAIGATLNHYVQRTGLRAILWHQGESDKGQSGSAYVSNLQKLIEVSRQDVGVSTLPWLIARASWLSGGGDATIVGAQNQVIAQVPYCYPGPNTDVYDNGFRQDGTHFTASFYPQLAELWNQSLTDTFFQQSTPYTLPQVPPRITVGQPQPAYQYAGGHLVIPFVDEAPGSRGSGVFYTAQLLSMSGQFVTNVGVGTTRPLRVTLPDNLTAGTYQIRLVSSAGGVLSTLSPPITVYAPTYAKGSGTGLTGEYMSGYDSNGPVLHTQVDGPIDFTWFNESPSPAMPIRDYIIRWTGEVEAPVTGTYTFKATYNDGARVWVNGQLLIEDWMAHPGPGTNRGQITLQANQRYSIRFDVLQRWYNAEAKLQWVVPGATQAVYIPKDRLYAAVVSSVPEAIPPQVAFPLPQMVFQRDNTNVTQLTIKGTCPPQTERIEVKVSPTASGYGQNSNSYVVVDNQPANGSFSGSIGLTGGWYNVDIQAVAQNQVIGHTRLTPVGVGEVFLIAGEANAQGITPMQSVADPADERVNGVPHYNYTDTTRLPVPPLVSFLTADQPVGPRGKTAWCWSELGDLLTKRLNVPVLFYNVAWAGTTVRNWRESIVQSTTAVDGTPLPAGMPYSNFKRVLTDYVPLTGLRTVLWQQGESEYYSTDPQAVNYATDLGLLIARSRSDAGFAQLPWVVARSSADNTTHTLYSSGSYEPVTNRQNQVIQTTPQVGAGPIADTIQMPRPDGKHFRGSGLSRLAGAWNQALTNAVWTAAPILPQPPVINDLRLSAGVNNRVKPVGSDFQFTLTVWNEGQQPASNVRIRCSLPQNLQFMSSASMTYQAGYLLASVPSVAAGQYATLSFTARPQQPGSYRVAAEIIRQDQLDSDSRPNTSVGNGEDDVAWVDVRTTNNGPTLFSASISENAPQLPAVASSQPLADPNAADLSLQFATNRSVASPNVPVSATLLVTNAGGQPAQNVQVGCLLPTGLSFTGGSGMTLSGSTIRGTLPSVPAGGQGLLTFIVTPTQSGNRILQAQIEAATPPDPDSTPNNGFTTGEDDTATQTIRTP